MALVVLVLVLVLVLLVLVLASAAVGLAVDWLEVFSESAPVVGLGLGTGVEVVPLLMTSALS